MFKKEGGKVKGYYTIKKLILGAVKGFIVTVKMGNLINCIKLPKNFTLKLKIWPLNIQRKMAKNHIKISYPDAGLGHCPEGQGPDTV